MSGAKRPDEDSLVTFLQYTALSVGVRLLPVVGAVLRRLEPFLPSVPNVTPPAPTTARTPERPRAIDDDEDDYPAAA